MSMGQGENGEEFFLRNINTDKIFDLIGRTDYWFLYEIKRCMSDSASESGVYLSDLSDYMDISITEVSKEINKLSENGYVIWKTDEKKERTYVTLTNKSIELMACQRREMQQNYEKIMNSISKEDLEITLKTMGKIKKIIEKKGE